MSLDYSFLVAVLVCYYVTAITASQCRYDDPVITNASSTCFDSKTKCPEGYICVRRIPIRGHIWQGCCTKGKGPCHTETQLRELHSREKVPHCDTQGNYSPKQCFVHKTDCYCAFPNGTKIEGSIHHWRDSKTVDCTKIIINVMKGKLCSIAGRWGKKCKRQCKCIDDKEQCERHTGYCKIYGSLYHGPKNQGIFKCWFGKPITRSPTFGCSVERGKCPRNHVCVTRSFVNLEHRRWDVWHGCCPSGKGPCDEEKQKTGVRMCAGPPNCDESGNFMPEQCDFSGCWCVFPNGASIVGRHEWTIAINCTAVIQSVIPSTIQEHNTQQSTGECNGADCLSTLSDKEKIGFIIGMSVLGIVIVGLIKALIVYKVYQQCYRSASSEKSKKHLTNGAVVAKYDELTMKNNIYRSASSEKSKKHLTNGAVVTKYDELTMKNNINRSASSEKSKKYITNGSVVTKYDELTMKNNMYV